MKVSPEFDVYIKWDSLLTPDYDISASFDSNMKIGFKLVGKKTSSDETNAYNEENAGVTKINIQN